MTTTDLKTLLKGIDVSKVVHKTLVRTSDEIVEWQKEQLFAGKKKNGLFIRPPYKPATIKIKKRKEQPTDRVTLKDTGDFYEAIIVDIGTQIWSLTSEDSKTSALETKYTPGIFGLNKISMAGYISDAKPVFYDEMHKATGL